MANHAMRARLADGAGAEYEANDGNLAATGGSLFVAMWVRQSRAAQNVEGLLHIVGNNNFALFNYRSGQDEVFAGPNSSSCTWTNGNVTLTDGNWHWITVEADYSGGAGAGVLRVSSDGVVVASSTGLTWTAPTTFSEFHIGGISGSVGASQLNHDDVVVFDGYMSDAERTAGYNSGDGVKGLGDAGFANATRTFYAGFDENSLTADYAAGTAAPIAGRASFIDGFWFGGLTGFETTTLGPDELHHGTNGEILYDPDRVGDNGYAHWSSMFGTYSDQIGRFRVAAEAGDIEARCEILQATIPMYVHIRFQTNGLQGTEEVALQFIGPDSRGLGTKRMWKCLIQSGQIQGADANAVATVDTEAWVDLKVQCYLDSDLAETLGATAVVNDEYELPLVASAEDLVTKELLGQSQIMFVGTSLTGTPYIEVASLAVHCHKQPATKESPADTFPDELHLLATSNAGRQSYDAATEHPFTDVAVIWEPSAGTWAHTNIGFPSVILDATNDRLLIWTGANHNEADWYNEAGMYPYNIGYGTLDLTDWPSLDTDDITQGNLVYRPDTPFLYPNQPGVIDDHDGRRLMLCTQCHLPDSPNFVGQCRGDIMLGELTDNETFVLANGGHPLVTPCTPPSTGDTQVNTNTPVYVPGGIRSMRYCMWGQAYGDRNSWGGGGASAEIRGMFLLHGETLENMKVWPTGSGVLLPLWGAVHTHNTIVRAADDFSGLAIAGGASRSFYLMRSRSPMLVYAPEQYGTFYGLDTVTCVAVVDDPDRGIWHLIFSKDNDLQYAYMRRDGFDWVGIDAGQTTGNVTTVDVAKPALGWTKLYVNVDADAPGQKLEVAVLDTTTGLEKTGFGQADCDDVTVDSTDSEVTWAAADLSSFSDAKLRFVFYLERSDAGNPTPRLYSYRLAAWPAVATTAKAIQGPRVYVRFAVADPTGASVLTDPASIDAVTTHLALDDTLVETITAWSKVADGHYYIVLDPAEYNPGGEYYVKVLWTATVSPQQTRKVQFSVARAVAATVNITGPIELTVEPETIELIVEE